MNATQFARARGRIDHREGRTARWRKRALAALAREAGAVAVTTAGRTVGHRMPDGQMVCTKQRYTSEAAATGRLSLIQCLSGAHVKPIRAYLCPHCHGWHLTSEQPHRRAAVAHDDGE